MQESPGAAPALLSWLHMQSSHGCSHESQSLVLCREGILIKTEGDFSSESALRALLRRNGKDFPVFSQAKCVPSCSEQTSGFGGCAAKSSAELGSSWAARVA